MPQHLYKVYHRVKFRCEHFAVLTWGLANHCVTARQDWEKIKSYSCNITALVSKAFVVALQVKVHPFHFVLAIIIVSLHIFFIFGGCLQW